MLGWAQFHSRVYILIIMELPNHEDILEVIRDNMMLKTIPLG